jgi:hypothetical protein
MNSSNGLLAKDRMVESNNPEVVVEIILYGLPIDPFEMTSGDDPGG